MSLQKYGTDASLERRSYIELLMPRSKWVDIQAKIIVEQVEYKDSLKYKVSSTQLSSEGSLLKFFETTWNDGDLIDTEYGFGLSIIHDAKDHYFYGIGITSLTEFQTIVQTYGARWLLKEPRQCRFESLIQKLESRIIDELFGPRSLVYGSTSIGLIDLNYPDLGKIEKEAIQTGIMRFCLEIIWPILENLYKNYPEILLLQRPIREQPALVNHFLSSINWHDKKLVLMTLADNGGVEIRKRAYVHPMLHESSKRICENGISFLRKLGFLEFSKIFDFNGYILD